MVFDVWPCRQTPGVRTQPVRRPGELGEFSSQNSDGEVESCLLGAVGSTPCFDGGSRRRPSPCWLSSAGAAPRPVAPTPTLVKAAPLGGRLRRGLTARP